MSVKFWQLRMVCHDEPITFKRFSDRPHWALYGAWNADPLDPPYAHRDKLDHILPDRFCLHVLAAYPSPFNIREGHVRWGPDPAAEETISAVEAYCRFGGTALEEIREFGSWHFVLPGEVGPARLGTYPPRFRELYTLDAVRRRRATEFRWPTIEQRLAASDGETFVSFQIADLPGTMADTGAAFDDVSKFVAEFLTGVLWRVPTFVSATTAVALLPAGAAVDATVADVCGTISRLPLELAPGVFVQVRLAAGTAPRDPADARGSVQRAIDAATADLRRSIPLTEVHAPPEGWNFTFPAHVSRRGKPVERRSRRG